MSEMQDKQVHRNEFRLRILLTNACNKDCVYCLNDFMPKPYRMPEFILPGVVIKMIRQYCSFMQAKNEQPTITFSGGEPGLDPFLPVYVKEAEYKKAIVKVVTNGLALQFKEIWKTVDCWHVHVDRKIDFEGFTGKDLVIQIVVTDKMPWDKLCRLVDYFTFKRIKVKLFEDFHAKTGRPRQFIEELVNYKPDLVYTRFTGKQENRGVACLGCQRKCVTLKALWVFPDGSCSTCPQGQKPTLKGNAIQQIAQAYELHMKF
jgi:organic radical activating enzyme